LQYLEQKAPIFWRKYFQNHYYIGLRMGINNMNPVRTFLFGLSSPAPHLSVGVIFVLTRGTHRSSEQLNLTEI
jgi:hypothetical protein